METRRAFLLMPGALALLSACGSAPSKEFAKDLNPYVGKVDKGWFLEKYGDPEKRTSLDATTEVWEYRFGSEHLNEYASRGNLTTSTLLRVTFRNGVFATWQASNALK